MGELILVTGGTGTLGRAVVAHLLGARRDVRVLSRRPRTPADPPRVEWVVGDLARGTGLEAAVAGAATVVHCATDATRRGSDVSAARRLVDAAHRSGTPHLVLISIVGVDRVPFSYYRAKREVEELVEASRLPWTVLRATQFHEFVLSVATSLARLPVVAVPAATSFQPVAAREVAARLAELAVSAPAGRVQDLGGPQVLSARELVGAVLRARGARRPVMELRLPGAVFAGYRSGGHLARDHADGTQTFEEFLAGRAR